MTENTPTREDFREAIEAVAGGGVYLERIVDAAWDLHQQHHRVLEVIRQRVSDGWEPLRGTGRPLWSRSQDEPERMDPSVAAVLWPEQETQ